MLKKHLVKRKGRNYIKYVLIILVLFVVLVNPFPVLLSVSEDVFTSTLESGQTVPTSTSHNIQVKPVDIESLSKYLTVESAFLGLNGNVSIYFKDLNSGKELSTLPEKSWIPASIIKAYVAAEAFHQRNRGIINFNTEVTIKADNVVPNGLETDDFPRLREGTTATIGQLVQVMVIQSDNTAYNTMLDVLDRRNVQSYIESLGIKNTIVGEKLNVDDNQQRKDSTNPGYQYNVTTSEDFKKLFDLMYNHKIPDSDELLGIFERQKFDSMIPAMIPKDVTIAHKTGEWAPIYHDGGIVYKSAAPFILSIFSNSNNPTDIAKLAQVAYFQDSEHVDVEVSKNSDQGSSQNPKVSSISRIYLTEKPSTGDVLAASTNIDSSFSLADLGITSNDLGVISSDQVDIPYTLITPASPIYGLKLLIENLEFNGAKDVNKPALHLAFAKERLSELKSVSGVLNQAYADSINTNFESNLKDAVNTSQDTDQKDVLLLKAKQLNDLHFVVLGNSISKTKGSLKEKLIDQAYQTYSNNEKTVGPMITNSPSALATKSEPVVGIVQSVKDDVATVSVDGGKTASIVLSDATKARSFNQERPQDATDLKSGDKIAVVGKKEADGKITAVFVLKNVPKVLTKTKGVVVEIQPQNDSIKIENGNGQLQNVQLNDSTSIEAKDTTVSIDGIKAGSIVTVTTSGIEATNSGQLASPANNIVINVNGTGKTETVVKNPVTKTPTKGVTPSAKVNGPTVTTKSPTGSIPLATPTSSGSSGAGKSTPTNTPIPTPTPTKK